MKRKIEIFTANCPVCDPVVKLVNELTCGSCDVTVYDLVKLCDDKACINKAKEYGVTRVPAVAVDGKLLNCCETAITREDLIEAGIGQKQAV
jgi:predicted thioredoxin/glutaredoxin